jgi:oligopeptide/dipeptide ABC transporter ATP-binding protein
MSILRLIFPGQGKITSGEILYDGKNILTLDDNELRSLRGDGISIVFQDPFSSLNPVLTIKEQVTEAVSAHFPAMTKTASANNAAVALKEVMFDDVERILSSYPHQLSGGQRQRIALAAAIINRPRLLIADEPTTALDVTIQKEVMDLMDKLKKELSLTLLLITHNFLLAKQRSGRIAVMYAGKIVELNTTENIFTNPLHPYTKALIACVPKLLTSSEPRALTGQPPDLLSLCPGCSFYPRCPQAMDICRREAPGEYAVAGAKVRCFLYSHN